MTDVEVRSHPEGPHAQLVILTECEDEGVFFQLSDCDTEHQVSWTLLPTNGCGHPARQPPHHGAPLQLEHRHTTCHPPATNTHSYYNCLCTDGEQQESVTGNCFNVHVSADLRQTETTVSPCVSCGGSVTTMMPPAGEARA